MKRAKFFFSFFATLFVAVQLSAHDLTPTKQSGDMDPLLASITEEVKGIHEKLGGLADEIPEDKYSWRPAEGVRSVSESFVHALGANYFLMGFFGNPMPEGFSRELEKQVTAKADVKEWLDKSYNTASEFIPTIDPVTLDDKVETPFGEFTKRKLLFVIATHGHEHLGQMIAYARMNGVTPPWSQKQEGEG